ncbi:MAG: hypothetical protein M5U19_14440 [Microthrixaceae bacterium]|nr:hypothetical protein [Microthrixaceae bacterium]
MTESLAAALSGVNDFVTDRAGTRTIRSTGGELNRVPATVTRPMLDSCGARWLPGTSATRAAIGHRRCCH